MIADPTTYSVADFIPFTAEVYQRLVVRQNEAVWPAQILTLLSGLAALVGAQRGWGRTLAGILVGVWAWVAVSYHLWLFTELSWFANYLAGGFLVQAGLIAVAAALGGFKAEAWGTRQAPVVLGLVLAAIGVGFMPVVAPLSGRGWAAAACFGAVPNPTVIASMGLLLVASRPGWLWLLLPIPLAWCAIEAAITFNLDLPRPWLMPTAAGVALIGMIWQTVTRPRAADSSPDEVRQSSEPPAA